MIYASGNITKEPADDGWRKEALRSAAFVEHIAQRSVEELHEQAELCFGTLIEQVSTSKQVSE